MHPSTVHYHPHRRTRILSLAAAGKTRLLDLSPLSLFGDGQPRVV